MYWFQVIASVLLLRLAHKVQAQSCFWPDGNEIAASANFVSCGGGEGHSQCCASGHACMSNGLCFNPAKGGTYRGGCTDKNWSTDACPRMCNSMSDFVAAAAPMAPCPPDADGSWKWWCGQDYRNVCGTPDENTEKFDYPADASIVKVAGVIDARSSPTTIIVTGPATASETSSLSGQKSDQLVPRIIVIAVGIGVGVPLCMIAITMGFFFWKERKRRIIAERLGYAGQAVAMAKQSYEVEISAAHSTVKPALKPALKHSPSRRGEIQRQRSGVRRVG